MSLHPASSWEAPMMMLKEVALPPHSSHPSFGHLILLVFEAVLEVVCVSLPGYIVARQGLFSTEMQKFVANLNVMLFTPCLIFTKLASQLSAEKLGELAVIPVIFIVQTLVSYLCSIGMSRLLRLQKRPRNFVVAMGVFGNSNSLPISLVISLSQTLKGLHWDKVPGDNDDEVAARGILYLMIFQQLGQLVRWSWGYHVLLAAPEKYKVEDHYTDSQLEQGQSIYRDDPDSEDEALLRNPLTESDRDSIDVSKDSSDTNVEGRDPNSASATGSQTGFEIGSGRQTPVTHQQYASSVSSRQLENAGPTESEPSSGLLPTPTNGNVKPHSSEVDYTGSVHEMHSPTAPYDEHVPAGLWGLPVRAMLAVKRGVQQMSVTVSTFSRSIYETLPESVQSIMMKIYMGLRRFVLGVWEFMNPPLWAMLAAIIVASVPSLQHLFFSEGTFIRNSVTRAISQSGGVAVPLILVVLGANLARNTLPEDPHHSVEDDRIEKKLLIASLVSRMLLPIIVMAPLLAVTAKYVPVSILDDPIFVIVCFLLTGAPSALQLAQICQINGVYMGAMSKLLFQSYVVWILPSTLILVMCALEVVEWAAA
ncbi:MAG: auxin efflux carrier superfamily [Lasallia pustulata]|uniref:Auxin efflux carrier superfamily n=1 Tax=Lasallia pustulata TaxID=136370 RepID=A0A5M8PTC2_9LECA|nr:MAG: auxin efflux carrier superfamily [Lasallia pustulata]